MSNDTFQRTPFGNRILKHALRDRARRDLGDPNLWVSPMFDSWSDGVYEPLRESTEAVILNHQLHSHARAVNSSQIFGFNLFMPFRMWNADPLASLLSGVTQRALTIESISFEYAGDLNVLSECAGSTAQDEETFTAADVGIHVRGEDGRTGLILCEIKLSEGEFTPCGGKTSPANRRQDICRSAELFFRDPQLCYLTRPKRAVRDRRYWQILQLEYGSVHSAVPEWDPTNPCPFNGNMQQLMRNHALALGMVQGGHFDFAYFGLVHHDDNRDVSDPFDEYHHLAAGHQMLFRVPASRVVRAGRAVWPEWANYVAERYDLLEAIHDAD